jgi:tetraacyldisaccharide 4'-kinase
MAWIERHWQSVTAVSALLYPLSLAYGAVAAARRGAASPTRVRAPVVVLGNVTVGGTGKTPLTLWLAAALRSRGFTPGIACSGYGGSVRSPQPVLPESDAAKHGDEAVLLARRSGCAVWAGADRVAAVNGLLEGAACDVVLCDDGLQHHRLARDVEICVVDGARGFGNGWLLPAGPLREPAARIETVDAVVVNGNSAHPSIDRLPAGAPRFAMKLEGREFRNLLNPAQSAGAEHFLGKRVHAVAGIGDPERFFRHLQEMGLDFTAHPFPDHHPFSVSDLDFPEADAVLMTEKDAVKCRRFANEKHWELPVDAALDSALADLVARKLRSPQN